MKSNKDILKILKTIETKKEELKKLRTEFLDILNELDCIVADIDDGITNIETGVVCIRAAVDVLDEE